jgi:hypothetical protein
MANPTIIYWRLERHTFHLSIIIRRANLLNIKFGLQFFDKLYHFVIVNFSSVAIKQYSLEEIVN